MQTPLGPTDILTKTLRAEGSIAQYQAVTFGTAADQGKVPAAAGGAIVGFAQEDAADGVLVPVRMLGITRAIASEATARGAEVAVSTNTGRVAAAGEGQRVVGVALEAAAAAGDIISVLIVPAGPTVPETGD